MNNPVTSSFRVGRLPFDDVIDWRRAAVWGDERLLLSGDGDGPLAGRRAAAADATEHAAPLERLLQLHRTRRAHHSQGA